MLLNCNSGMVPWIIKNADWRRTIRRSRPNTHVDSQRQQERVPTKNTDQVDSGIIKKTTKQSVYLTVIKQCNHAMVYKTKAIKEKICFVETMRHPVKQMISQSPLRHSRNWRRSQNADDLLQAELLTFHDFGSFADSSSLCSQWALSLWQEEFQLIYISEFRSCCTVSRRSYCSEHTGYERVKYTQINSQHGICSCSFAEADTEMVSFELHAHPSVRWQLCSSEIRWR